MNIQELRELLRDWDDGLIGSENFHKRIKEAELAARYASGRWNVSERSRPCTKEMVDLIRSSTVDELAGILWPLVGDPDQAGIEALSELVRRARAKEAENE